MGSAVSHRNPLPLDPQSKLTSPHRKRQEQARGGGKGGENTYLKRSGKRVGIRGGKRVREKGVNEERSRSRRNLVTATSKAMEGGKATKYWKRMW